MILILGQRQAGKTEKLIELMYADLHGRLPYEQNPPSGLLLVNSSRECNRIDRLLVEAEISNIHTKTWEQRHSFRGRQWSIVAADQPPSSWSIYVQELGHPVDYLTVETPGEVKLVEA